MVRIDKLNIVDSLKEKTEQSSIILFVDFRGLNVSEITELRSNLRREQAGLTVFKNTLARIALKDMEITYPDDTLVGPSGIVHSQGDPAGTAKVIADFIKSKQKMDIKGGLLNKSFIDSEKVKELAKLPSRDELIQKTVGLMKSPITNFVMLLSGQIRGLVNVLDAIKEKKQEVKND